MTNRCNLSGFGQSKHVQKKKDIKNIISDILGISDCNPDQPNSSSSMTNRCNLSGFGQSKHVQKKKDIKNIISDILGISDCNPDQPNSSSSMTNRCNLSGFGQSKHVQKKKDIKNIISDILGISDCNPDQPNSSSSMTNRCNLSGFGQSKHVQKQKDIKNIISDILGISDCNPDQPNSSFAPFRSHNNESITPGFSKASNFQSIPSKTVENETETEDLFKSKRFKSENGVSFVTGTHIFDVVARDKECEPIKSETCQTKDLSQHSEIFSAANGNFSCLDEFSPVKCTKKPNLNETYDVLPLDDMELTEQQTGTKPARSETEEYIYEGDILNMTFSDQSNAAFCESITKLEQKEEELTLTQFFTQQNLVRNMNILEPYQASSTVRFHESIGGFSMELSKDIVSVNQSKFELELKDLISETETLDSMVFTQPTITGYSLTNQIVPETTNTQYSLMDIFSPTQENTSSPKLTRIELCCSASQRNEHLEQNLTDISFENFNNTTRVTSKEFRNSQNEITRQETLNFSNFSEIFKSGATQLGEVPLMQVDT